MLETHLLEAVDQVVPAGVTHIGFIGVSRKGEFALARPQSNKWGTTATFAKESVGNGQAASQVLLRCLRQYGNATVEGLYPVPQVWATPGGFCFFFAGLISQKGHDGLWTTDKGDMAWYTSERSRELLVASKNLASRARDLALLDFVEGMCLSPHHQVLLMLRELHLMGFEQLRAPAYDYPIAWRCPIVPASWTLKSHGGLFRDLRSDFAPFPSLRKGDQSQLHFTYSSAQKQQPFGWSGVAFASPEEMAHQFLREFPHIAALGWGPDGSYVDWFSRLLPELFQPYRTFAAFGEFNGVTEYLHSSGLFGGEKRFPLPPPGTLDPADYERYMVQFNNEPAD